MKKILLKLSVILLGMVMLMTAYNVRASEITSAFTGEKINRETLPILSNEVTVVPITLKIQPSGYQTNEGYDYWSIIDQNEQYKDIYCLNLSKGFGSPDGNVLEHNTKQYQNQYNLKELTDEKYKEIIGELSDDVKKEILWILNEVATSKDDLTTLLSKASEKIAADHNWSDFAKEDMKKNDRESTKLSFEDVKIIQQIAIWHFTNPDCVFENTIEGICDKDGNQISQENKETIYPDYPNGGAPEVGATTVKSGEVKQAKFDALYKYLVEGAEAGKEDTNIVPTMELSKKDAVVYEQDGFYIAGPFELTATNKEYIKSVSISGNYTILNESKETVNGNDIKDLIGKKFYLKIAKNGLTNASLTIEIEYKYDEKTFLVLTDDDEPANTQPVVLVLSKEVTKKLSDNFDINLTQVSVEKVWEDENNQDGIRPESIEVQLYKNVDGEEESMGDNYKVTLDESNNWTHTWENILAKENGKDVTYTVKETAVPDGYVVSYTNNENKLIITNKHIPKSLGIQLQKIDEQGNIIVSSEATFEITVGEEEPITLKTTKGVLELESQKIVGDSFEFTYRIKEVKAPIGYEITFEELVIKISGTIKEENGSYIIENVEITDEEGNELDETKVKANYNAESNDVIIQIINKKKTNVYSVKLLKVGEDGKTPLSGAWFKIDDGEPILISDSGEEIAEGNLTEEGNYQFIYKLEETEAPEGYMAKEGPIEVKINVKVELIDDEYQITEVSMEEQIEGVTVSVQDNVITITVENIPLPEDKQFDLALRKFITKVNEEEQSREPEVDASKLGTVDESGNTITDAKYTHSKTPLIVEKGDIITYTIRVYNEGTLAGYANEITDTIPEGLEYLPNSSVNVGYRWKMIDSEGNETDEVEEAVKITTDYLSEIDVNNEIAGREENENGITLYYKDVEVQFRVIMTAEKGKSNSIKNVAQISKDSDKDIDSDPTGDEDYEEDKDNEDDIDREYVELQYFDLALRKFITKVNNTEYNNRYPEVEFTEDGEIKYNHTKDPVTVKAEDIIIYTIRVYNEGEKAGYAEEITDNLPEGLEYLPENEINKQYGWKLIDAEGNETEDITKAVKVTTDYLKDQIIEGLIEENGQKILSYKDVQIAFKVEKAEEKGRIIVNTAQISKDSDDDIDSTPDNNDPTEDDEDKEYVKEQYFDLSLKKWVTETRVTYKGKTTVTKTGFTEDSEEMAKVDLVASQMSKTTVKFAYTIKVTNEGEIAGYAEEVKDYIPEGLEFKAEDNPDWKEVKKGEVVTEKLKDTLLNPGESATVEIVLTWKNGTSNTGVKTNYAEISKDSDDDIDSTPDNYNKQEDDIDDAQVILSIKTAATPTYIGLIFTSIIILAGGAYIIKKYVID